MEKSPLEQIAELSEREARRMLLAFMENRMLREISVNHRLAVISEDAESIRSILKLQGLFDDEHECFTLLNNIQIACDLSSNESLSWTLNNKSL